MSYSFNTTCSTDCPKYNECTDRQIVSGAIQTIHSISVMNSHKGGGSISHDCVRKEQYKAELAEMPTSCPG